jgi:hypothetical protein
VVFFFFWSHFRAGLDELGNKKFKRLSTFSSHFRAGLLMDFGQKCKSLGCWLSQYSEFCTLKL